MVRKICYDVLSEGVIISLEKKQINLSWRQRTHWQWPIQKFRTFFKNKELAGSSATVKGNLPNWFKKDAASCCRWIMAHKNRQLPKANKYYIQISITIVILISNWYFIDPLWEILCGQASPVRHRVSASSLGTPPHVAGCDWQLNGSPLHLKSYVWFYQPKDTYSRTDESWGTEGTGHPLLVM